MRKFGENPRARKTLIAVLLSCASSFCAFYIYASVVPSSENGNPAENVYKTLINQHSELLIEKGICDEKGREIDGRLGRMIQEARARGMMSDRQVTNCVLEELNYSPANLGRFPECAFDRPIGHTLRGYGRTAAPGNIEAQAEGSACPVGGIGAGSFEWTMSGHYRYWFMKSGWMVDDTVWADQFHVFMKQGSKTIAQTLSTGSPPTGSLQSWEWEYPMGKGSYYALFPKSGFSYERNEAFPVKLAVTQFSPVIPNNYKETSYPVAVYKWVAENPTAEPAEVSVMLTWQNMIGWEAVPRTNSADFAWDRKSGGNSNVFVQDGLKKGIVFQRKGSDLKTGNAMSGSMCIAAAEVPGKTAVSFHADFDPANAGSEIWTAFSTDGTLSGSTNSRTASIQDELAGAIAVKVMLGPGERVEFPLVIAWDLPYYEFEKGVKYQKKYTEFFGASGERAFAIAGEALEKYKDWEKAIDEWQSPILADSHLSGWLKQALFNELYVLAETSIWDASTGLHTYLESADYLMYGTFDVDSYCWHILKLWPELEMDNIRFFARSVEMEDPAFKQYQYSVTFPREVPESKLGYYWNTNKVRGMMPHDLGSPQLRPWVVLNAFDWQNGNVWKDLNPKFPLRAYRDFLATGGKDYDFLADVFRASVIALDTLEKRFGHPNTHVPLNEGIPDQTYDTWKMKGESAYVTMLWLSALKSTWTMGWRLIGHGVAEINGSDIKATIGKYQAWFEAGRTALRKLWDEGDGYFHIDVATDDIMTDQLFGVWYSDMLGLEEEEAQRIIPRDEARRALRTIFEKNVLGFGGGLLGAVNGRKSDGGQLFSQQGDEVWVGTAYAFAANCALHGLRDEALRTAYGIYHVVYSPFGQGYYFKTPEAYLNPEEAVWNNPAAKNGDRLFRAMKYMRPGAVWALYEALLKTIP
jgi:non-lysosomal glucosylceramidase